MEIYVNNELHIMESRLYVQVSLFFNLKILVNISALWNTFMLSLMLPYIELCKPCIQPNSITNESPEYMIPYGVTFMTFSPSVIVLNSWCVIVVNIATLLLKRGDNCKQDEVCIDLFGTSPIINSRILKMWIRSQSRVNVTPKHYLRLMYLKTWTPRRGCPII